MRYSLVIPVFNNQSGLQQLLDSINTIDFLREDAELIFVDDASIDGSWERLKQLKINHPNIKILRLGKNFGQHGATLAGMNESIGQFVLTMDDDLEVHPSEFSKLIAAQEKSVSSLVYGEFSSREGKTRKFAKLLYKVLSKSEGRLKGKGSSFRLIEGELARKIAKSHHSFVFIDEFLLWYTSEVEFVKVETYDKAIIKTRYKFSGLVHTALHVMMYSTAIPLRLVTFSGFLLASANFLLGIFLLYKYFIDKIKIEGYISLMVAILFSTGLILIGIGVIAQYLRNMMKNLNKAPTYFVSEKQC